jgi:hypothetical protein
MTSAMVCILVCGLLVVSCSLRSTPNRTTPETAPLPPPSFDPLETPADREVVPELYPVPSPGFDAIKDSLIASRRGTAGGFDSSSFSQAPIDVYRVQVFTSRLYVEANRERLLAEEIFSLPVYLDFEVPYYKVRVGDFATREEAEKIIPEMTRIGYPETWVARVIQRVMESPAFEGGGEPILPDSTADTLSVPRDTIGSDTAGGQQ